MTRETLLVTQLRFAIVAGMLTVSVVACGIIQYRAKAVSRERDLVWRDQAQRLISLTAENQRLSNLVEQVKNERLLPAEQFRDLLRLRGEIGQLRLSETEQKELQKTNAQLRAARAESQKQMAEAQAAPNYWPKEQLAYAGYASPESAMKSMLWAMRSGNLGSWQQSCTPQARADLEREWRKHGMSDADIAQEIKTMSESLTAASTGFHIVEQTDERPDKVVVNLSFDGEGKTRKFVLKRIGDEWKFHNLLVAGQEEASEPQGAPPRE